MQQARERLLHGLWEYTNRVEVDEAAYPQTAIFYLDLGILRDQDAHALGRHLQDTLADQFASAIAVGLAHGKFPAYVAAAGHPGDVTLVPRHQEAVFVAPYTIDLLPTSKATARRLALLCIREIGQLAALPREAVIGQFGREGKLLYSLAWGLDSRPVKPRQMPEREIVSRQFDPPLQGRTRLDVVLHHLAENLARRLEGRGSRCHELSLSCSFEDSTTHTEQIVLLAAVGGSAQIAGTLQQLVERTPPTKNIARLELTAAHLVPDIPRQLELFSLRSGRTEVLDLGRTLSARYGDRFYQAVLDDPDSLLPERRFRLVEVSVDSEAS